GVGSVIGPHKSPYTKSKDFVVSTLVLRLKGCNTPKMGQAEYDVPRALLHNIPAEDTRERPLNMSFEKYVVPTGRVVVSTGRVVVPTGRVISPGRIPTGRSWKIIKAREIRIYMLSISGIRAKEIKQHFKSCSIINQEDHAFGKKRQRIKKDLRKEEMVRNTRAPKIPTHVEEDSHSPLPIFW
nr:hypothetical protein [Tanacetum cinerariifolium]